MWQHSKINRVSDDGMVVFEDGHSIEADTILHCTGYKFHFPFLKTNDMVHVDNNRVGPLYKHVFPPQLVPRLAFVGLIFHHRLLFQVFEMQSKWVALVLSGKIVLPSEEEMLADACNHYREMEEFDIPKPYTHSLHYQFDYVDWLSDRVGLQIEDRLRYTNLFEQWISHSNGFREATIYDLHTFD